MGDELYFSLSFIVMIFAVTVAFFILNTYFHPDEDDRRSDTIQLANPILVFAFFFLCSKSIYFAHELGFLFQEHELYVQHWSKSLMQVGFIYAFWSCIRVFSYRTDPNIWKCITTATFSASAIIYVMLRFL